MKNQTITYGIALYFVAALPAGAQGISIEKNLALPAAQEAATTALEQCRKDGYKVTVSVVDNAGRLKAVLRDDGAAPHTLDSSRRKAYTALSLRMTTNELVKLLVNKPESVNLKDVDGFLALGGGVPIRADGVVIGAIGVGGAPGGDKDETCAKAGLDRIAERLK